MKRYIKNLGNFLILSILILASCSDFLDEDPKGKIASSNFFAVRGNLDQATHGLYTNVASYSSNNEIFVSYASGADMETFYKKTADGQMDFDLWKWQANNHGVKKEWLYLYTIVKNANYIINNADRTPVEEEIIDAYKANAYFWRAWAYHKLVTVWGPVPMVLEELPDLTLSPAPVADIWTKVILPDIEKAQLAPSKWQDVPACAIEATLWTGNAWVTKAAAQAAAAYMYMSYAGWPNNGGAEGAQAWYAKAAGLAEEVIDKCKDGTYYKGGKQLFDECWKVHSDEYNFNNSESLLSVYFNHKQKAIFQTAYIPVDVAGYNSQGEVVYDGEYTNAWGEINGELYFWSQFPEGDRKQATYAPKTLIRAIRNVKSEPIPGVIIENHEDGPALVDWWDELRGSAITLTGNREIYWFPWFCKTVQLDHNHADYVGGEWKYQNGWTGCSLASAKAHIIIRLSEVYCWFAEAAGRAGLADKYPKAQQCLNEVRNRANQIQGYLESADRDIYNGYTGEQLAEAAYREHRWEVAGSYWGNVAPVYYDDFRMDRVKDHFAIRKANVPIEITYTINDYGMKRPLKDIDGNPVSAIYRKEVLVPEGEWSYDRIYAPYPQDDVDINPNLKK